MFLINNRIFRLVSITAAGAILLLYFFVEPRNGNLPKCLFHELTGLYCPGCGGQRSLHALLNGHVLTAISYNLLFVLLLPLLVYFLFRFVSGKKYKASSFIYKAGFSFVIAIVVVSFWILRNIPGTPFSWLAP
jgi:hypothetical protein